MRPYGITQKWFKTLDVLHDAVAKSVSKWLEGRYYPGTRRAAYVTDPELVPDRARKLIGRDNLKSQARSALEHRDRVLLHGFAGTGKTALTSSLASEWITDKKGPVLWLRAGTDSSDVLCEALAQPFDQHREIARAADKTQAIHAILRASGVTLLVIDDAWDSRHLADLLRGVPDDISVLITSRQLHRADTLLDVGELSIDFSLEALSFYSGQDYVADNTAVELCKLLGYHAFALEVAGGYLKYHRASPATLIDQIPNVPHDINIPKEFTEIGRENVAALLEVSLNMLPRSERLAFETFGAFFSRSLTPEMLELHDKLKSNPASLDESSLIRLVEQGLARVVAATPERTKYYQIHDLSYSYAREQSEDRYHVNALTACVKYSDGHNTPTFANFAALNSELDNFLGAIPYAIEKGLKRELGELIYNLFGNSQFLSYQGLCLQEIRLMEPILSMFDNADKNADDKRGEAIILCGLSYAYLHTGQTERAIDNAQRSLSITRDIGDKSIEAIALCDLGDAYHTLGQAQVAIGYYQQALDVVENNAQTQADSRAIYRGLGSTYHSMGQTHLALKYYQEDLIRCRKYDDERAESGALGNLGLAYGQLGQLNLAVEYHQQALTIGRRIGDKRIEGNALGNLGSAYAELGQITRAIGVLQEALAIHRKIGDKTGEGNDLGGLGSAYATFGQIDDYTDYFKQALDIHRAIGNRHGEASWLIQLGHSEIRSGRVKDALSHLNNALGICQEISDKPNEASAFILLGKAFRDLGEMQQANDSFQQALAISQATEDKLNECDTLNNMGILCTRRFQFENAVAYLTNGAS